MPAARGEAGMSQGGRLAALLPPRRLFLPALPSPSELVKYKPTRRRARAKRFMAMVLVAMLGFVPSQLL